MRQIGQLKVSPLGLGCMGFSHAYGEPVERQIALKRLYEAYEIGYRLFDTAAAYNGVFADGTVSSNEMLVGKALKSVRDKVVISTKFGIERNPDKSLRTDSSPQKIRASLENSLKALGTDYIDIYYQHRIDESVSPEEVASTMADLIKEGKIRAWGISETGEEYLRRAHQVCPVCAIQNRYSMMARWHEKLFPVLEELKIAFVAFSPMANGLLSGAVAPSETFGDKDYRKMMPQFTPEGREKAAALLELLNAIGRQKNASLPQISLAWMLCKKPYIIPIPGGTEQAHIAENFAAAKVVLTPAEIKQIDDKLNSMDFLIFGGSKIKNA